MSETIAPAAPAASPAPAPAPAPVPAAAAPAPVAFAESLPEAIRGEAVFRDIKDLDSLAKGYLSAQKMLGHKPENLMVVPGPDDATAMEAIYNRLGRPEKPGDYKLSPPPEGMQIDPQLRGGYLEAAHKAGLSNRQADAVISWYDQHIGARVQQAGEQHQAALNQTLTILKAEWGQAFEQNITLAKSALQHYGDPELVTFLNTPGPDGKMPGDDPRWLRSFAKLGKQLAEDGIVGRPTGGDMIQSPGEARQEINALQTDKPFMAAYMDKKSPGHADAIAKMERLYQRAHPQT